MDFRKYVRNKIKKNNSIIEFGPLNRPLFTKEEFQNIYYADIRSTDEIKKLYSGNDYLKKTGITIDLNSIVDIDFKIEKNYKTTFKNKKFDVAYLSHVIEHMPDIIEFFQEIYDILNDNGVLIIIYPDKRYCFDHFRNEVSFRDAYSTYKYGYKENARVAFDFAYNVIPENNAYKFWHDDNIISQISKTPLEEGIKYYNDVLKGKILDDVHLWPFSDYGFLKFIYEMQRANLLRFTIEEFYPTEDSTQEFLIILKKTHKVNFSKTIDLLKKNDLFFYNQNKINQLEKENNCYKKELEEYKGEISRVLNEYNCQINDLKAEANKRFENYEQIIQELRTNIKDLNKELSMIYNSASMRLTKPLRILKKFFTHK